MKVKELIEKLKTLTKELEQPPPDDEIWVSVADGEYGVDGVKIERQESGMYNGWVVECDVKC